VRDHAVAHWLAMLAAAGFEAACLGEWRLALDFEEWVARMQTPAAAVAQLRSLLASVSDGVRERLGVRAGERPGFDIPIALFTARKAR
jgi:hypothetical protein